MVCRDFNLARRDVDVPRLVATGSSDVRSVDKDDHLGHGIDTGLRVHQPNRSVLEISRNALGPIAHGRLVKRGAGEELDNQPCCLPIGMPGAQLGLQLSEPRCAPLR